MKHFLYKITVPDGRSYIGVSTDPYLRFSAHHKAKSKVGEAIRLHNSASLEIIASGDASYIYELERRTIENLKTRAYGLNVAAGGGGQRNKIQISPHWIKTRVPLRNPNYSAEARAKMRRRKANNN